MATISLPCICGRSFAIDTALAGTRITCPTCSRVLTVPSDDIPVAAPATPARVAEQSTIANPRAEEKPKPRRKVPAWFVFGAVGWVAVVVLVGVPFLAQALYQRRADSLQKELNAMPAKRQAAQAKFEKEARDRHMALTVTGPASFLAGAPNAYTLETKTLADEPAPAKLTAVVKNKAGAVVAPEKHVVSGGRHTFTVPPSAALKPDEELTLEVTAERDGDHPVTLAEKLTLERPGYVTHLTTDKPLYQPGEVVSFRSLTLDRFRLQPVDEDLQLAFALTAPDGQTVAKLHGPGQLTPLSSPRDGGKEEGSSGRLMQGPDGKTIRGIGVGEFAIAGNAPGGEYTLTVSELRGRFAPESRKFLVNRYQAPRLHKEMEFTRRSFGPGDEVMALCKVTRIEGGKPLADQPVTATVMIDGKRYAADGSASDTANIALKTDANGAVAVKFKLPKAIDYGEASLSVQLTDGGNNETIVRPIPIVVRRMRVDFYPEGGDLVAGVPNQIYFTARTPIGKPAEVKGRVVDANGKTVVELATLADEKNPAANQGMGVFTFTPAPGQKYELQIDSPPGIPLRPELPAVKPDGVVLRVDTGVTNDAQPVTATVRNAGEKRKLLTAAFCRGRMVASESFELANGESKTSALLPPSGIAGVFRVTVYEDRSTPSVQRFVPLAERLVFRQAAKRLNVELKTDKAVYTPGEKVRLTVTSTDETAKLAPAIALVSVVDKAALSLADDKTLRAMPSHFLLTSEIRKPDDLENADFLLSDNPSAATAVDLLLGTQGWRRFAEQEPAKFKEVHGADADRLMAAAGLSPVRVSNKTAMQQKLQPELNEARRKAESEFGTENNEMSTHYRASQQSATWWNNTGELTAVCGGLLLVIVVIVAVLIWGITALQKASPVTGAAFSVAFSTVALIFFLGVLVVNFAGCGSSNNTFSTVDSACLPETQRDDRRAASKQLSPRLRW